MNTKQIALEYAARGWSVFPCQHNGKKPATENGFHDATVNPDTINTAFVNGCNVGIATGLMSGVFVVDVDVDPDKKIDGSAELKRLVKQHGDLPPTYCVMTPRGGRHYYFTAPHYIKSRTDVLARGIDIRADGGYVVAPPSSVDGKAYKVVCSTPPAAPPAWVVEMCKQGKPKAAARENSPEPQKRECNKFITNPADFPPETLPTGNSEAPSEMSTMVDKSSPGIVRNCAHSPDATRLRSALQFIPASNYDDWLQVGMALKAWNPNEGFALWDEWSRRADNYDGSIMQSKWDSFQSAGVTVGSIFHLAQQGGWNPKDKIVDLSPWLGLIRDAATIVATDYPPPVEIVQGIVTEQSKLVIGSGSKSFKTWLTQDMGLSISHETLFLGRKTARRRVLYVNLELRPSAFERRIKTIAEAKGIIVEPEWFFHLPLRGKLAGLDVEGIVSRIIGVAKQINAKVVVCDPVYKMNIEGEENNSRDQTLFFNQIDRITTEAAATVILNDHFSKGNQSEKDPLDAIRGSSAKGGDVDAAMILRRHEVDDCFRVDIIHRELPPVEPFCIGWQYPQMVVREDLDAEAMKKPRGGRQKAHEPEKLAAAIKHTSKGKPISFSTWATLAKITRSTLMDYVSDMRIKGWIETIGEGSAARQYLTPKGQEIVKKWMSK